MLVRPARSGQDAQSLKAVPFGPYPPDPPRLAQKVGRKPQSAGWTCLGRVHFPSGRSLQGSDGPSRPSQGGPGFTR
jgi:hypothetical protein